MKYGNSDFESHSQLAEAYTFTQRNYEVVGILTIDSVNIQVPIYK